MRASNAKSSTAVVSAIEAVSSVSAGVSSVVTEESSSESDKTLSAYGL